MKKIIENFTLIFFSLKPYWLRALEAGLCMVFTTVLALPIPLLSVYIIDYVIENRQMQTLHIACGALALAIMIGLGLSFLQRLLLLIFTRRVFFDLEIILFKKTHTLPMPFFQKHSSGYIATRISDDVRQLRSLMAGTYIEGLSSIALLLVGLGVMVTIHSGLTVAVLAITPGFLWVNLHFGRRMRRLSDQVQEKKAITTATRLESLDATSVVRAFERGRGEVRRLARDMHSEVDTRLKRDVTLASAGVLQMALYSMGGLFLLWYGAHEIMADRLTLGQFVAFNTLMAYVYGPVNQLSGLYVNVQKGLGILKRVFEMMEMPPEKSRKTGKDRIEIGPITFENVFFSYEPHRLILNDFNLTLNFNHITAIVGPTGVGKTTLVNLLLRFYDLNSGRILVGGINILEFNAQVLRRAIGWVGQDVRIFSGTIRENIAYGKYNASEVEILTAADAMNCMEFIERFPEGLNTRIGSGGVQLSGGQKQRIALARAIIRNPKILILDEATSSLDPRSESLVKDALKHAAKGRTTLLIAHRLSTVSIADYIHVLADGQIVEEGTFHDLLKRDGHFKTYYQKDGIATTA